MHVPWLIVSLSLLVVSTFLVLIGFRGRRINDHPICRRCGFDLFGKPAESTLCSECGADLATRKAVRIGRRERQTRLLAVAGPALILSIGWSGWDGWRQARRVDWNPRKPVWWLVREANGRDPAAQDAALIELARRIGAGRLPSERRDALVGRALDVQADRSRPWAPAWGTVVEAAHDTGGLSREQWQRYMIQALAPVLQPASPQFRRCDPFAFRIVTGADRVGAVTVTRGQAMEAMRLGVSAEPQALVDGRAVNLGRVHDLEPYWTGAPPPKPDRGVALFTTLTWAGPVRPVQQRPAGAELFVASFPPDWLADGRHSVKVRLRLVPLRTERDANGDSAYVAAGEARSLDVETNCSVVAAAAVNPDEALRPAVERGLSVDRLVYRTYGRYGRLEGFLRCSGTPIPLAYRISLTYGRREFDDAGAACFTPGGFLGATRFGARLDLDDRLLARADIELVPDRALAPPEAKEIWGGSVTLRDVPIVAATAAPGDAGAEGAP